jgi:hypothetical protein
LSSFTGTITKVTIDVQDVKAADRDAAKPVSRVAALKRALSN